MKKNSTADNKANRYYICMASTISQYFKLCVPGARSSFFQPVFPEIIDEYDARLQSLAFKLYTNGLTTKDINGILGEVIAKKISPLPVSNIVKDFEETRKLCLDHKVDAEYYFLFIDALRIATGRGTVKKRDLLCGFSP